MTFRVNDLLIEVAVVGKKKRPTKKRTKPGSRPKKTYRPVCGPCTQCTHTGTSTCSVESLFCGAGGRACNGSYDRNLIELQQALRARLTSPAEAA